MYKAIPFFLNSPPQGQKRHSYGGQRRQFSLHQIQYHIHFLVLSEGRLEKAWDSC